MILKARVAQTVNSGLTLLYWQIGTRVRSDILREKRAEYGQQIVAALGQQLEREFGRGFSRRNLFNMVRFAEVFPDFRIVQPLSGELDWTHFCHIIYLDDQRDATSALRCAASSFRLLPGPLRASSPSGSTT